MRFGCMVFLVKMLSVVDFVLFGLWFRVHVFDYESESFCCVDVAATATFGLILCGHDKAVLEVARSWKGNRQCACSAVINKSVVMV